MTPIERAARAMYDTVQPEWDWDDPDAELLRKMYRENARAAILAIREPSEAMREVNPSQGQVIYAEDIWQAMIDAMLDEG